MPDKVRFGVISTAKIGLRHVIPAMQRSKFCEIAAIASRDAQRAAAVARSLGIPRSFGSYDQLLADSDIDAVYNPLPNHLHVPVSLRAMEAGKHVLCEKPIGLNVAEAEQLLAGAARAPHLKIMEAFMYRHHPQWQTAAEYVAEGRVGELRTIHSFFSYFNRDPEDIRNSVHWGGGGLMDIGCYSISLVTLDLSGRATPRARLVGGGPRLWCGPPGVRFAGISQRGWRRLPVPRNWRPTSACRSWGHRAASKLRFRSTHPSTGRVGCGYKLRNRCRKSRCRSATSTRSGRLVRPGHPVGHARTDSVDRCRGEHPCAGRDTIQPWARSLGRAVIGLSRTRNKSMWGFRPIFGSYALVIMVGLGLGALVAVRPAKSGHLGRGPRTPCSIYGSPCISA